MACKYCQFPNTEPVMIKSGLAVEIVDAKLWVEYYDCDDRTENTPINFCPMCRRDLRGESE